MDSEAYRRAQSEAQRHIDDTATRGLSEIGILKYHEHRQECEEAARFYRLLNESKKPRVLKAGG